MSEERIDSIKENMKTLFEQMFRKSKSESLRNIFREAFGSEYSEIANPDGFVTNTDLQNFAEHLKVGPGDRFIDLGCGRGGPGLLIARKTGANYLGIDLSQNAINQAKDRVKNFDISCNIEFKVGDISSLDYPDNSFNGAISIDALIFVPNLPKTFLEISRILQPKSILAFTAWEPKKYNEKRDFRSFLLNSGFDIKIYEVVKDWERRQREVYEKTLQQKKTLIKDMGRDGAFAWIMDAKTYLHGLKNNQRIYVVAKLKN